MAARTSSMIGEMSECPRERVRVMGAHLATTGGGEEGGGGGKNGGLSMAASMTAPIIMISIQIRRTFCRNTRTVQNALASTL